MVSHLYTTKAASAMTGASRQIIRTYTERYKDHFSSQVQAEPGQPRRFTERDLKLIAYIYQQTGQQGQKHEQVLKQLSAGALDQFAWQPPDEPTERSDAAESQSTALIPIERLQATQVLMLDAQRREQEVLARERELQTEISRLQNELGLAKGELAGYKAAQRKPPRWWQALFGSRSE